MKKEEFLQKIKEENKKINEAALHNFTEGDRVEFIRYQFYFEKKLKRDLIVFSLALRDQDDDKICIWRKEIACREEIMEEDENTVYITLWRMWEELRLLHAISNLLRAKEGNPAIHR